MRKKFPRTLGVGALILTMAGGGMLLGRAYIGHSWTMADEVQQQTNRPEQVVVSLPKPINQTRQASGGMDMALLAMPSMHLEEEKEIKPISTTCIVNSPQMGTENNFSGSGTLQSGLLNGENGGSRDFMGGSAAIRPIYEGKMALSGGSISVGR